MAKANSKQVQESDRKLQAGIDKHFKGSKTLTIAGKDYKPDELVKVLQAEVDAADAAEADRLKWLASVKMSKELQRTNAPTKRALRGYIASVLGEGNPALGDFGLKPRKARKVQTIEEKALVVGKLRATRAARHTMGKRQKELIVGQVPAGAHPGVSSGNGAGTGGSSTKPALAVA